MTPLTALELASVLADVAREIAPSIAENAPRAMRSALKAEAAQLALERCLTVALFALTASPGLLGSLSDLKRFLTDFDVVRQLAKPLDGSPPNATGLADLFVELVGKSSEDVGLDFTIGAEAYSVTFRHMALSQLALSGIPRLNEGLNKAQASRRLSKADESELDNTINQLTAGNIQSQNLVVGTQQTIYRLFFSPRAPKWEDHYLRVLITHCDPLDVNLGAIDETSGTVDEMGRLTANVGISSVFATLTVENEDQANLWERLRSYESNFWRKHSGSALSPSDKEQLPTSIEDVRDRVELTSGSTITYPLGYKARAEPVALSAVKVVSLMSRIVILGEPGGGKSSLVNHIAVQLARRRLGERCEDERMTDWRAGNPIPIRIVVREFASWLRENRDTNAPDGVWAFLEHQLSTRQWECAESYGEIKSILTESDTTGLNRSDQTWIGVVFFDGLDEVRAGDDEGVREAILTRIADFAAPLRRCKVVVTCRTYAYKSGEKGHAQRYWRLPEDEFPVVTLAPLEAEQIGHFVRDWYRIVGPKAPRYWDQNRCDRESYDLHEAIKERPYLLSLGKNPLMLTLMAQVHGYGGVLPNDRAELFERAVQLLLLRWEARLDRNERGGHKLVPSIYQEIGKTPDDVLRALQAVAYEIHSEQGGLKNRDNHPADIPRSFLLEKVAAFFFGDYGKAQRIVEFVQTRAGLLVARDFGVYRFPHRIFQEFLAACHIIRMGDPVRHLQNLISHDVLWWKEVFLLACGSLRKTPSNVSHISDYVVGNLPPTGKPLGANHCAQIVLVEQALHETHFVRPKESDPIFLRTRRDLQAALLQAIQAHSTLTPYTRSLAGNALGRLGDPRFDSDRLFLPEGGLCGFVHLPADPSFKIGTRIQDFERAMLISNTPKEEWGYWRDETMEHTTPTGEFYIAKYPVTNAQLCCFLDATGHESLAVNRNPAYASHPATGVGLRFVREYCSWLNAVLCDLAAFRDDEIRSLLHTGNWRVSIPTDPEWEKALRGRLERNVFPWGDKSDNGQQANYRDSQIEGTSPVGCFPATELGCFDMVGNVWELTRSEDERRFFLRGGSYRSYLSYARCASRVDLYDGDREQDVGFRLSLTRVSVHGT